MLDEVAQNAYEELAAGWAKPTEIGGQFCAYADEWRETEPDRDFPEPQ